MVKEIYTISCEFFDQLNVAMQRKIPSTVVYLKDEETKETLKGIGKNIEVGQGKQLLVWESEERMRLDTVGTLKRKRHREE